MRLRSKNLLELRPGEWILTDKLDKEVISVATRLGIKVIMQRMLLVDMENPEKTCKVVKVTRLFDEKILREIEITSMSDVFEYFKKMNKEKPYEMS